MIGLVTSAERSYLFDVRQFHRMIATGIFGDQKVELVGGKIYAMTDLPPHTFAVGRLFKALLVMLAEVQWTIRAEQPVLIGRFWAPRPDIAVSGGTTRPTPPGTRVLATSPSWSSSPTRHTTAIAVGSGGDTPRQAFPST